MKIIQLAYRKIINAQSSSTWEKYVFEDSYKELQMQFQYYNQDKKHETFSGLLVEKPAAEKLHFLVSAAITGYITQLKNKIPDVCNVMGRKFLPFNLFRFEIIDSNIRKKEDHIIAINFYSEFLQWIDTVSDHLLLSLNTEEQTDTTSIQTEMLKLQPFISIHTLQYQNHAATVNGQNILS